MRFPRGRPFWWIGRIVGPYIEDEKADKCVSRAYRECKKNWVWKNTVHSWLRYWLTRGQINKRKAEGGGLFG